MKEKVAIDLVAGPVVRTGVGSQQGAFSLGQRGRQVNRRPGMVVHLAVGAGAANQNGNTKDAAAVFLSGLAGEDLGGAGFAATQVLTGRRLRVNASLREVSKTHS